MGCGFHLAYLIQRKNLCKDLIIVESLKSPKKIDLNQLQLRLFLIKWHKKR